MDLRSKLLQKLESPEKSLHLLHLVVQNWIVFQRDSFDFFDENGDPFTTQLFLIEISTGKYIHRAQGFKVDFGATLDPEILYSKLTEAFVDSKVCQGFPVNSHLETENNTCIQEFPYKRSVAQKCQYLFKPNLVSRNNSLVDRSRWICPVCEEAWSNNGQENKEDVEADLIEMNPMKLEVVLDEETELFPNAEEEPSLEYPEEFEFDLESDEDAKDDLPLRIRPTRHKSKKRKINEDGEEAEEEPAKKIYSCNHCTETFLTPDAYQKHQREKRKVGCKECKKDIVTFKQLIEHTAKAHPDVAERYVKYGQNTTELKSLKLPKKCSLCDMIFNGNVLLYRHRELYHELGEFKCSSCQEPCLTYYDLVIHNYQKHDQVLEHIQPQTYGLKAVSKPDGKIEYKRIRFACQHCDSNYTQDSGWTLHMRHKHSWGLFECKTCDEACHYATDFSTHMLTFHPDNPEVKCPTPSCSHVSDLREDPDSFNWHYKECRWPKKCYKYFPKENVFQCDTCGKKYSSKIAFDAHIKQHQGIERFKCSHCDYGTNIKMILIDHEKNHLRDKGLTNADTDLVLYHQCDQCGKEFSQKQTLRDHIKRIHLGIVKVRQCKDCGQTFQSQSSLYIHKRKLHGFVSTQQMRRGGRRQKKADKDSHLT
ncbi:zinc finger protein 184-like [Tigriopus californicus]|uniref:zinc finger protein 184-like n=1 Tax=Tigriopus californicus TaxID=6832 RepID=UPI0027DA52D1|nr:zinc finger protein 184-like [Tigriopus californicus]